MVSTFRAVALAALALSSSACMASVQSHGEYLHTAPFASFHTFSFVPAKAPPEGYEVTARSAQIVELMKPIVSEALVRKGYVAAPEGETGDVVFACAAGRRDTTKVRHVSWRQSLVTGEATEERDFVEGGLVIDAFDRNGGQVWHGASRTEIDPARPSLDALRRAVGAALVRFPARPGN